MQKLLLVFLFLFSFSANGGTGAIPSGPNIKLLKDNLRFKNTDTKIMTNDSDDPTSVAKDAEIGSLYIRSTTGVFYQKQDSGSSTNWLPLLIGPSGSGTDNRLVRWDGTGVPVVQDSLASLDDVGALSGLTQLDVDNIQVNGNSIISTDVNGDVNITPNGSGEVVASTLEVTDLSDNTIIRADGANGLVSSGVTINASDEVLGATRLTVDNVEINGNTVDNTASDLLITATGGDVLIDSKIIGSPTYTTYKDIHNLSQSSGTLNDVSFVDNADGTIDVSAIDGLIRATNSDTADLLSFSVGATSSLALTDANLNWIYVEYNAGSPQVVATTTERTDYNTNVLLGKVYRDGTKAHMNDKEHIHNYNLPSLLNRRFFGTDPYAHDSGADLTETGTRNIAISAGTFWHGVDEFTTAAFDSSGAGTFSYWYVTAGTWTQVTGQTQIDNTQYNDTTTGLQTLTNNRYGVHWVYLETDGDVMVVYGQGDYLLPAALDAQPDGLPDLMLAHAFLVGKIIIQKNSATFYGVSSAFDTNFVGAITDHNLLSNLQGGAASEYYHLDATEFGFLNGQDQSVLTTSSPSFAGLTVDNLNLNGNTISSTAGDVVIAPTSADVSITGELGIGIATPARDLHISGTGDQYLKLTNTVTGETASDGSELRLTSSGDFGILQYETTNDIYFQIYTTEFMRLDGSTGNMGFGSNAPDVDWHFKETGDALMKIEGGASNESSIQFKVNSTDVGRLVTSPTEGTDFTLRAESGYGLDFHTGGSNSRFQIDSSGNAVMNPLGTGSFELDVVLGLQEESTPSTPSANEHALYFKSDNILYSIDDSGDELPVDKKFERDYLLNWDFEKNTAGENWTSGAGSLSRETTTVFEGSASLKVTLTAQTLSINQDITKNQFYGQELWFSCQVKSSDTTIRLCTDIGGTEYECSDYYDGSDRWLPLVASVPGQTSGTVGVTIKTDGNITDDVFIDNCDFTSKSPYPYKNLQVEQFLRYDQLGSDLTNGTDEIEFNLSNLTNTGSNLISATDDSGNTRTKFTANKDIRVHVTLNAATGSSDGNLAILKNGTVIHWSSRTTGANETNGISGSFELSAGDYITVGFQGGRSVLGGADIDLHIVAVGIEDHVITPARSNMTDPEASSATLNWTTNTTHTANQWRVGKYLYIEGNITLSGAPDSATLTITLPETIDTSYFDTNTDNTIGGWFDYIDGGVRVTNAGKIRYATSTTMIFTINDTDVTQASPITWANTDEINYRIKVPIASWRSDATFLAAIPVEKVAHIDVNATNHITSVAATAAYKTITLSTLSGDTGFASISSNQLTLKGVSTGSKYEFCTSVGADGGTGLVDFLVYNITGAANYEEFQDVVTSQSGSEAFNMVCGNITTTAATTFEFRTKSAVATGNEWHSRITIREIK